MGCERKYQLMGTIREDYDAHTELSCVPSILRRIGSNCYTFWAAIAYM